MLIAVKPSRPRPLVDIAYPLMRLLVKVWRWHAYMPLRVMYYDVDLVPYNLYSLLWK